MLRGDKMANHEFGIIDSFDENKYYGDYEPKRYDCISVNDDLILFHLIEEYGSELSKIKTFFQSSSNPNFGLDYYGVTLIPPSSLEGFYDLIVLLREKYESSELDSLIEKISKSINENKYLIHYGI
jgi:hypothetical protein